MHKKDGKVYASLTEVKNKTGDIFAIVDQYGEIFLTSYNKIRYRISKEDIHDVVNIEEKKSVKPSKVKKALKEKTEPVEKATSVFDEPVKKAAVVEVPAQVETKEGLSSKAISIVPWDRNNMFEKNFTEQSMKPLITN